MKNILKVTCVIIGTIIGAGFASGQEIWIFFNRYQYWGLIGIIVACALSGILIYKVFQLSQKYNITTYSELLQQISQRKAINQIISIVIQLFLLISFYVMVAGMSAYFNQEFKIPIWICSIIMSIFCYIILQKDIKGIVTVNTLLIPCLVLFILYLGFRNFEFTTNYFATTQIAKLSYNWILSSVLYASYNSIVLIPILVELKTYLKTKGKIKKVSILCCAVLILLGSILFCLLLRGEEYNHQLELPMIGIVKEFGITYSYLYGAVVVVAIFTSAISAGYGFLKNEVARKQIKKGNVEQREKTYYQKLVLAICISAPIVANFGFSNLVGKLYPVFGILGLVQLIAILWRARIVKNY